MGKEWKVSKNIYLKNFKGSVLTYLTYSSITSSTDIIPCLRNIEGFHIAARANMTEDAPVVSRNCSISSYVFMRSREPPLQKQEKKNQEKMLMLVCNGKCLFHYIYKTDNPQNRTNLFTIINCTKYNNNKKTLSKGKTATDVIKNSHGLEISRYSLSYNWNR